jgi:tRNA nucleotidyltransferase (CCA-adding enzyme)
MRKLKSAGVIVYAGKRYLLLRHLEGHWSFPKGLIKKGETTEQAALRELKEETGISVKLIDGFKEKIDYTFLEGEIPVHKEVTYFLGEATQQKVKLSGEHKAFAWLEYDHALRKITYNTDKDLLKKAFKFKNQISTTSLIHS